MAAAKRLTVLFRGKDNMVFWNFTSCVPLKLLYFSIRLLPDRLLYNKRSFSFASCKLFRTMCQARGFGYIKNRSFAVGKKAVHVDLR